MKHGTVLSTVSPWFVRPWVTGGALFGGILCCASLLHAPLQELQRRNPDRDDPLAGFLGDARRLFANHFYVKADAYFHSGYYPTVFDNRNSHQTPHVAEDAGVSKGVNTGDEERFLGEAASWIDSHGRHHFPSRHTHLGEENPGDEREILPWLKFSASLNPNLIENYTVAAYWLRRIGNHEAAEDFLREGLKANPRCPEIFYELGRGRALSGDTDRARNLWEHAWGLWREQAKELPKDEQNRFLADKILMRLAVLESHAGRREVCLHWLRVLLTLKDDPTDIVERIQEVEQGELLDPKWVGL